MRNDSRPLPTGNRSAGRWGWMALCGGLYLVWGLLALAGVWERLAATGLSLGIVLVVTAALQIGFSRVCRVMAFRFPLLPVVGVIDLLAGLTLLVTSVRWVAPVSVVIGIWAIVRGIADGVGALDLRRARFGGWRAWFAGAVATMAFGFFVLAGRLAAAVDVTAWIGIAVITIGLTTLGLSRALRHVARQRPVGGEPSDEQQRAA